MDTKPKDFALLAAHGIAASGLATLLAVSLPLPLLSSSSTIVSALGIALMVLPLVLGAGWVIGWPTLTGRRSVPACISYAAPFIITTEVSQYWSPIYEIESSRVSYLWLVALILIAYYVDRKVRSAVIRPIELPPLTKGVGWALLSYGLAVSVNSTINGLTMIDPLFSSSLTTSIIKSGLSQFMKDVIILGVFSQKELILGLLGFLAISVVRGLPFFIPALALICIQAIFLGASGYDWVGTAVLVGTALTGLGELIAFSVRLLPRGPQT